MTPDIALILGIDGIATGSIYVLVGLGLVLIFSVTRVVFVPFGDIVAFSALTLASIQLNRLPGTVYLIATLALVACAVEAVHLWRRGHARQIPRGLFVYGVLPLIPAVIAWLTAGTALPSLVQIALAIALVAPIGPLIERIALQTHRGCFGAVVARRFRCADLRTVGSWAFVFWTRRIPHQAADHRGLPLRQRDCNVADAVDGRVGRGIQPAPVPVLRAHAVRQGAACDRDQSHRRAHCRYPPGKLGYAGFFSRVAPCRDLRNFDQPGDDALLRFRLHHRAQGFRRRHHRRPRQLSGHGDRCGCSSAFSKASRRSGTARSRK